MDEIMNSYENLSIPLKLLQGVLHTRHVLNISSGKSRA